MIDEEEKMKQNFAAKQGMHVHTHTHIHGQPRKQPCSARILPVTPVGAWNSPILGSHWLSIMQADIWHYAS